MSEHDLSAQHGASTHHTSTHHTSTRLYWMIGAILTVVTAIEVAVTFVPRIPHWLLVTILILLSVIKGAMVVMYFMHLKGDAGIFAFVFLSPFFMAISMALIFLVLFSGHVGIAG